MVGCRWASPHAENGEAGGGGRWQGYHTASRVARASGLPALSRVFIYNSQFGVLDHIWADMYYIPHSLICVLERNIRPFKIKKHLDWMKSFMNIVFVWIQNIPILKF